MADRLKRFRLHVVKEIYETERDYTRNLEFTVAVRLLLPRLCSNYVGSGGRFCAGGVHATSEGGNTHVLYRLTIVTIMDNIITM